jgi:hypothetical protein
MKILQVKIKAVDSLLHLLHRIWNGNILLAWDILGINVFNHFLLNAFKN